MRPGIRLMLVLGGVTAGVSAVLAGEGAAPPRVGSVPATAPATQPVTPQRLAAIQLTLARLASVDSEKRDEARRELMALVRSDLPTLREAIRSALPLEPSQAAVLRDIVTHVYLTGDSYPSQGDGFLGVTLPSSLYPEQRALLSLERGVAVVTRLPGFCAFRMLEDGDVIIGLAGHPDVEFKTPEQLTSVVKNTRAGQTVVFDVIRHGQILRVPIRLDRRPTGIEDGNAFTRERERAAEAVWERDFAPLLAREQRGPGVAGVSDLD